MKLLKLAILPAAVLLMGFTDKTIDMTDGESFHASLQAMIKPLPQAKKEELVRVIYALPQYHQCERDLVKYKAAHPEHTRPPFYDVTKCARRLKEKKPAVQNFLKTGRMDSNVHRLVTVTNMFMPDRKEYRGHSKEESWQRFVDRAAQDLYGKSGHDLINEYSALVDARYDEAVEQHLYNETNAH